MVGAVGAWLPVTTAMEEERLRLASLGGGTIEAKVQVDHDGRLRLTEVAGRRRIASGNKEEPAR
jgi:hypothetical protein